MRELLQGEGGEGSSVGLGLGFGLVQVREWGEGLSVVSVGKEESVLRLVGCLLMWVEIQGEGDHQAVSVSVCVCVET